MRYVFPILAAAVVQTGHVHAENRQLDAHEHGSGMLNMAVEGNTVVMEFEAPGHDIVGFEYEASSDKDLAAIEAAVETLESPLALFAPNNSAGCDVAASHASLVTEEDGHEDHEHEDEDHEHEGEHDEDHEEHAHEEHDEDHDEDHAEGEDHDEDHADDHDAHDHEDEHEASHTEFRAEYTLTCDSPEKLTSLAFPYFQTFPNAEELDVQLITEKGAFAFEADRANPTVDLQGTQ